MITLRVKYPDGRINEIKNVAIYTKYWDTTIAQFSSQKLLNEITTVKNKLGIPEGIEITKEIIQQYKAKNKNLAIQLHVAQQRYNNLKKQNFKNEVSGLDYKSNVSMATIVDINLPYVKYDVTTDINLFNNLLKILCTRNAELAPVYDNLMSEIEQRYPDKDSEDWKKYHTSEKMLLLNCSGEDANKIGELFQDLLHIQIDIPFGTTPLIRTDTIIQSLVSSLTGMYNHVAGMILDNAVADMLKTYGMELVIGAQHHVIVDPKNTTKTHIDAVVDIFKDDTKWLNKMHIQLALK